MSATSRVDPNLVAALKRLRLGRIAETLPERLALAEKQDMPPDELLLLLLTDEIARRDGAATSNRVRDAGLDPQMRIELWDKTSKVSFDRRLLNELTSLRFLEDHKHVVVLGAVGVGKTFLASALGHIACRHGYHVRFLRADVMLRALRQSRLDNSRVSPPSPTGCRQSQTPQVGGDARVPHARSQDSSSRTRRFLGRRVARRALPQRPTVAATSSG